MFNNTKFSHFRVQQEYERRICSKCGEIFWTKKKSNNKICIPCLEGYKENKWEKLNLGENV